MVWGQVIGSDQEMSDRPTTWCCRVSLMMLKHGTGQPTARTRIDSQMCSRISTVRKWCGVQSLREAMFSSLGPPWKSTLCIEGYLEFQRVHAVDLERSGRRHQPFADEQSGLIVYVTGLSGLLLWA